MRFPMIGVMMLGLVVGCDIADDTSTENSKGGIQIGGGAGGATHSPLSAAQRTVDLNAMKNLHLFIESASVVDGRLPTPETVLESVKRDDPKLAEAIEAGDVVLTGAKRRESIWAYTKNPVAGEHMVVSNQGVERMAADKLQQRLENQ